MNKKERYKIYVLLKRTSLDVLELEDILTEKNRDNILKDVLFSILYLYKDKNQGEYINAYMDNMKRTIMELMEEEDVNIHLALEHLRTLSSTFFSKRTKHKSIYQKFLNEITEIFLAKKNRTRTK